jgi:hypothetical protein
MHQDIIQSFLDQPEVVGIALMQGRIIPYFYVKENFIDAKKRIELIRHFRNNILETPIPLSCAEFQIDSYYAYTYKLKDTLMLLIISDQDSSIIKSIINSILQPALQSDLDTTIKLLKILTKKTSQPTKNELLLNQTKETSLTPIISAQETLTEEYRVDELVKTLNTLSQIVCSYLGPKITSNFLQITRPKHNWISNFKIKSNANIEFLGVVQGDISPLQHLLVREWTNKFMNQCSQIVKDLPTLIDQKFQNKKYRRMISILPNGYLNKLEISLKNSGSLFD